MGATINPLDKENTVKAIKVSFLQSTARKPLRMKADDGEGHSIIESYDYIDADLQAAELAKKLTKKLGWKEYQLISGSYKNDWYFVQLEK